MSNFKRICLFVIFVFALSIGWYFLLERDEWDWLIAKKQVNQFVEFDYEGMPEEKPDKIESMELQTKFAKIEDNLNLGFRLTMSIGEQENKTRKTSFAEFVVKGREAGYTDNQILDKLAAVNTNFKDKVNLARASEYAYSQIADYLYRWGSVLKVVEEVIGYHVDLNIYLLDKDGFCLETLSYGTEKRSVFDNLTGKLNSTDFADVIVHGKGKKVIQKTIQVPIPNQLAKKVKSVTFWPVIRAETKLIDIGLDEDEIKRLQEEYEKENSKEENYAEDSCITE